MTSPYRDSEHLYAVLQRLFQALQSQNSNPIAALERSRLVIRLDIRTPQASVLIDGRSRPARVLYAHSAATRPDLDVRLQAAILHRILLDELSLKEALARRLVMVRGPIWKVAPLREIFAQGRALYPAISAEYL